MLKFLALGTVILVMGAGPRGIFVVEDKFTLRQMPLRENGLELVETDGGHALASSRVVEPLAAELRLTAGNGREMIIEPGVRATLLEGGSLRLSSHDDRPLVLKSEGRDDRVKNPVVLVADGNGWTVSGTSLPDGPLRVALADESSPADPAPSAADAESPVVNPPVAAAPKPKPRMRRVFVEEPLWTKIDRETLRRLQTVSPAGF